MDINWKKFRGIMSRSLRMGTMLYLTIGIVLVILGWGVISKYGAYSKLGNCLLFIGILLLSNMVIQKTYQGLHQRNQGLELEGYQRIMKRVHNRFAIGTFVYFIAFMLFAPHISGTYYNYLSVSPWVNMWRNSWNVIDYTVGLVLAIPLPLSILALNYIRYSSHIRSYLMAGLKEQKKEECMEKKVKDAVEKRMKSERMKIDLIANVSHDLKTPLTSIVSYLELLGKLDLVKEARDYVDILNAKAGKLSEMVESLFDLAKVSSGNAEIKLIKMNLNRLIEQVMLDMEDEVSKSGIPFKVKLCEEKADFIADGNYMYRVCQNLLENVLKYSLQGTRAYITTAVDHGRIRMTILNTASYEMDFTEDEIVERFSRGDKSRTTEGNGLGLAIIKSYTEACGGEFILSIEGDQFKTVLSFVRVM